MIQYPNDEKIETKKKHQTLSLIENMQIWGLRVFATISNHFQ